MSTPLPAFAPPAGALVHPACAVCRKRLPGTIWGAVLRCRRCKSLLLLVAGQPVRVVDEGLAETARAA